MSETSNRTREAAEKFDEILLDAIEQGQQGNYGLCTAIVEAFRQHKGEEKAQAVRRVLWQMIQEEKS